MRQILAIVMVLGVLAATVQAQPLPDLILPNSWDGTGWIFEPPAGCGVNFDLSSQGPANDPVIGPITGFQFDILSQPNHFFRGVALPWGFDAELDAAWFTVTPEGGASTTIQTTTWADRWSNLVIFPAGVKSFTISWGDAELFFDPETPEGQTIFPVWWGVTPYDCQATVKMTPIPEPSTLVLLGMAALSLLAYAWRRRRS